MKSRTIIVSAIVHVLVASALLLASERKHARRATAISMAEEKKKEKPREPEKPKPVIEKPKPARAPEKKAAAEPQKAPTPEAPPPKSSAPAPVDTGLTLGDADGPGMDIGGPKGGLQPVRNPQKVDNQKGADPKRSAPAPKKKDDFKPEDDCQEDATKPEPISKTEIEYTQAARAAGVEGRLVIRVTVDKDGGVSKAEVVSSVDAQLDAAAIAAVERWRFKPAKRCGKPIFGGVYTLARRFELGD